MPTRREIRLRIRPERGLPAPEHFALVQTALPVPAPGEVLVRNRWFAVSAAVRTVIGGGLKGAPFPSVEPGDPLFGAAVGEVVSAPHGSGLRPGDLVSHRHGWRGYAAVPAAGLTPLGDSLPDPVAHLSQGWTAYAALTRGAEVRAGDTVLVTGGAGAVGTMTRQIARLLGAGRVIGSTGSPAKAERLVTELGYDAAVVRGAPAPFPAQLAEAAPEGVDVLLDTVGGEQLSAAVAAARPGARAVLVGALSGRLDPDDVARVRVVRELLALGLTIEDVRACVDRLPLLDMDAIRSRRVPEGVCVRASPVVSRRLAALDAEIARLTRRRDELAARAAPPPHPEIPATPTR
ncbi:zinc-binding dehydrogenase [Streptomyces sp. NRRL B-24572]|uniref:zinc-binding dehydrogenase n=1 Tax=Streptomyces sp. NRRL B-24572 TaxID=1962156 RepID=UPI0015C51A37|nr:zinc-binding dehydrogenase [Streptomyces sp. NRRL B-24572]